MRITNSMIMNNAGGSINGTKVLVDKRNTQMTTQKKIQRPSEDPVIAVRSLRLQTTLSKVNQYYEKNIPDAESWMDVTETALTNIKDIVTDMRTLANRGATETLTQDDRNTILSQMKALQEQVYNEGNADYAGRTVFTGYRTNKSLTFINGDTGTSYVISEPLDASLITRNRYYTNKVTVPNSPSEVNVTSLDTDLKNMDIKKTDYNVLRLAYDSITDFYGFTFSKDGIDYDGTKTFTGATSGTGDKAVNYKVGDLKVDKSFAADEIIYTGDRARAEQMQKDYAAAGHSFSLVENDNGTVSVKATAAGTIQSGYATTGKVYVFESEADWAQYCKNQPVDPADPNTVDPTAAKTVGDNDIVVIKETGEMILGDTIASEFMTDNVTFKEDYYKKGFAGSELRPEYYFDCVQLTDETGAGVDGYDPARMDPHDNVYNAITDPTKKTLIDGTVFDKQDDFGELIRYDINYTVAQNQELTVNLEAGECIDHNIYQDMEDMIDAVENAIASHEKVEKIKKMMKQDQYADETSQSNLAKWLETAQKEADYYDDNLSKMYSEQLGICDNYLEDVNLSITQMGCKGDQLAMTKTRMNNQQETVQELQSTNDDMDLSNIILKYTAAYTAYQSSLTAAGKLGQQTLLNYI